MWTGAAHHRNHERRARPAARRVVELIRQRQVRAERHRCPAGRKPRLALEHDEAPGRGKRQSGTREAAVKNVSISAATDPGHGSTSWERLVLAAQEHRICLNLVGEPPPDYL
jgi:hypothetical protein